ncbi:unnamed protein product, partial [Durusdinium trenchii]
MRMPNVGPLPVDLHVQQLKRRPVSSLPTMDLEEASERIIHCLKRMKQDAGSGLLWEGKTIRVGTRFSGIGAVEEGLCILEKHTPSKFQVKYACDIDEDCFNFYRSRFSPSQQFHYFSNVMDVVNVDPTISKLTFLEKQKVVEGLTIKKRAICKCHKKECTIPGVLMDVSGSICKDYSPQGQQKGVEGVHALSMLVRNAELRRRKVPLRISENVVSAEGQKAIASSMSDCDLKYVITMCEDRDAGYGAVRRDRGWLAGVCPPLAWVKDPNETYQKLCAFLSEKQVSQDKLWFADGKDDILQKELQTSATRFRPYENGIDLYPASIV